MKFGQHPMRIGAMEARKIFRKVKWIAAGKIGYYRRILEREGTV